VLEQGHSGSTGRRNPFPLTRRVDLWDVNDDSVGRREHVKVRLDGGGDVSAEIGGCGI